jgi:hypothetical protein
MSADKFILIWSLTFLVAFVFCSSPQGQKFRAEHRDAVTLLEASASTEFCKHGHLGNSDVTLAPFAPALKLEALRRESIAAPQSPDSHRNITLRI